MTSRDPERAARRTGVGPWLVLAAIVAVVAAPPACVSPDSGGMTVRLSIATGGTGGVYYPYGGGIAKIISEHVEGVEATAEVTAGTVDNLKFIASRSADLAFGLADSIDDAANQRGAFAEFGAVPMRALAVLYDNYNHLVSVTSTGIETVADLEGHVVSTGAPGSGTEVSAFRILEAAGVDPNTGIRKQSLGASQSVDAIKDDKIDAFFFSGGLPTGAILDLASTPRAHDQGRPERRDSGDAAGAVRVARLPQLPHPADGVSRHGGDRHRRRGVERPRRARGNGPRSRLPAHARPLRAPQ